MWFKFLVLSVFLFNYNNAEDVGEECIPNDEISEGVCTVITNCQEAVRAVKRQNYHPFYRCGFDGVLEVVCCPAASDRFGNLPSSSQASVAVAERECQKIVNTSIPPLEVYIIAGERASRGEFPHMVALGFNRGNNYQFDCGGSLISNLFVITAAHCVNNIQRVAPSIVRVGTIELGDKRFNPESDITISEIIVHPDYLKSQKYHDLALIRLEKPVEFNTNQNAVCLYTSNDDPVTPLVITGWGQTNTTRAMTSDYLLKANVTVVKREKCSPSYANWRKLPHGIAEEQICAGDPEGIRDTCQGDSGGPLQGLTARDGQFRLIGITSFGRSCGTAVPGVYTRISRYIDWIVKNVWPNN